VRALALDRSNHEAAANRKLTFEVAKIRAGTRCSRRRRNRQVWESRSAEFALADEVNLGTYHLRALMGEAEAPTNTAEIALNVERYVLRNSASGGVYGKREENETGLQAGRSRERNRARQITFLGSRWMERKSA